MRRNNTRLPVVELMIVVIIIVILATIAKPRRFTGAAPAAGSTPGKTASQRSLSARLARLNRREPARA
ncbi:MAG TPA: hypothetical protein VHE78_02945 [Gemmatimonadaceae bacterium]|nr:hypothetical protein [Gemmatimonadaceae bacterium]